MNNIVVLFRVSLRDGDIKASWCGGAGFQADVREELVERKTSRHQDREGKKKEEETKETLSATKRETEVKVAVMEFPQCFTELQVVCLLQ